MKRLLGLTMELHPTIRDEGHPESPFRIITLTCKYIAEEPLTIQFYVNDTKVDSPPKYYNESTLKINGWHGEHMWHTTWNPRLQKVLFECHTLTRTGKTRGVLTTRLPETGSNSERLFKHRVSSYSASAATTFMFSCDGFLSLSGLLEDQHLCSELTKHDARHGGS